MLPTALCGPVKFFLKLFQEQLKKSFRAYLLLLQNKQVLQVFQRYFSAFLEHFKNKHVITRWKMGKTWLPEIGEIMEVKRDSIIV